MPLVRISMKKGKSLEYRKAIADGVYQAMRESFNVPDEDRFIIVSQHDEDELDYSRNYLNIQRSDGFIVIQIACNNTRTVETKKAFYHRVRDKLVSNPGIRSEDIFINLVETGKDNWSFGNGEAQYA